VKIIRTVLCCIVILCTAVVHSHKHAHYEQLLHINPGLLIPVLVFRILFSELFYLSLEYSELRYK